MFEEIKGVQTQGVEDSTSTTDPYSMFLFTMRSPKTREKCTGRLRMFFDFLVFLEIQWKSVPKCSVIEQKIMLIIVTGGLLAVLYGIFNIKKKELREKR